MKKSLAVLAACMVLALCAVGVSRVQAGDVQATITYTTILTDTLGSLASDSVKTTDQVNVFGARGWILVCIGSQADTLAAPVVQYMLPGGVWAGTGGVIANFGTPSGLTGNFNQPTVATSTAGSIQHIAFFTAKEFEQVPWGTPVAFVRFRLKGNNARRYAGASSTNLQSATGTTTWRIMVIR